LSKHQLFQVDAFATRIFGGNPAAICPLEDWLPSDIMQDIASENNLSETAFFVPEGDDFSIRWFTPAREIALCGHATLAAGHVLFSEMNYRKDKVTFHTQERNSLTVEREKSLLKMVFPSHTSKKIDYGLDEVSEALGAQPKYLLLHDYLMAVFSKEEEIVDLSPHLLKLSELSFDGFIATAPGNSVDFVSRFFGPKLGIPEDPVTGSAHCQLIPYWANELNKTTMIARQLSKRGGELHCCYAGKNVTMAGQAITYLRGTIETNFSYDTNRIKN